jgi:hypothetical protein
MKKADKILLIIAGLMTFFAGILHFTFFKLFNSAEIRNSLKDSWALIHPLILGSILLSFMVAYISVFHSKELINTKIGRPLLVSFTLLYLIRLISEFVFMGYKGIASIIWILICVIPVVIYIRIFVKNLRMER